MTSKVSGRSEFSARKSSLRAGTCVARARKVRYWGTVLICKADGLVQLDTRGVGHWAEVGIANHIQIGEACETEGLTEAAAAGVLFVIDGICFVASIFIELIRKKQSAHFRGFVFETAR